MPQTPREVGWHSHLLDWNEDDHPRDEGGRFGDTGVSIKPVKKPAWDGDAVEIETEMTKQEVGALGEQIAIAHLKANGLADARQLNLESNNFPVDLVGDHQVVEVKTGLASNGDSAQQWRATIGQPGIAETEWLKTASAEDKRTWNQSKQQKIINRKERVVRDYSDKLGVPVKGRTMGIILNPDRKVADIYLFDGFHSRIAWKDAKKNYVGSFKYAK